MATVIKHVLLFTTEKRFFKEIKSIDNRTIFSRYKKLEKDFSKFDDEFRYFLAYPFEDNSNNKIEFHGISPVGGNLPQPLSDLTGEERERYQRIKDKTLSYYNQKISELADSSKDKASFIAEAIKYVDDRFVYCYDDKVVLGAWGMQLRTNIKEDITEIRKKGVVRKVRPDEPVEPILPDDPMVPEEPMVSDEPINSEEPMVSDEPLVSDEPEKEQFNIRYITSNGGQLEEGKCNYIKEKGSTILDSEVPEVMPWDEYEFVGWSENPNGKVVDSDMEFVAKFKLKAIPWWLRLWRWFKGLFEPKGCLWWLIRLLLLLILLFLLMYLFRDCHGCSNHREGSALSGNDSIWQREDPNTGHDGGIYDPEHPYQKRPTPPGYEDILPPEQGVLPPINENPEILPGNPSVLANRLNILMENEDKSILDLAREFKTKYPDDKYKIVYYDDVVKRMQIEIPKEERLKLKEEIPGNFAPKFELFVFDEAMFESDFIPNDPAIQDQNNSWYLEAIHASQAWEITKGSSEVSVAIVDNGFNLNHPELKNKVVRPYNVWTHDEVIFAQQEDHGTHVAGTALAEANNGEGICGVAQNCKFIPVQVADRSDRMTTTSVLDGIIFALYQGADVINVSLGTSFEGLDQMPIDQQEELIRNHFKEEERLWREVMRIAARHNATIVIAAGNDNVLSGIDPMHRPELFVTVAAVDKDLQDFRKARFSNYGNDCSIAAPGVDIFSCVGNSEYATMSGTSMAAPIVTGAVALMKSINPNLTNKQIICILQGTGAQSQGDIGKMLQLDKALEAVKANQTLNCSAQPVPSTGDVQILLNWQNYNDLDLVVTDPNGETVWFKNKRVASGGKLEIDMNVEYPDSKTPFEHVFWPHQGAPSGTYNVYVLYFKKHENANENLFKVSVKYGDKTENYSGNATELKKAVRICSFTLNGSNASGPPSSERPDDIRSGDPSHRNDLENEARRLRQELDRVEAELRRISNSR